MKTNERKLISTTDFVLEQNKIGVEIQSLTHQQSDRSRRFYLVSKYAKFLKQPLTLEKFVPCDDEGNVLEEPIISEYLLDSPGGIPIKSKNTPEAYYYRKAKERVLFKGFYSVDENTVSNGEINIIFGRLTSLIVLGNNGYGRISKKQMLIEDLVDYNLTITDEF